MTTRVINVSEGAVEYVTARVTETADKDITGATFLVGLGGYNTPPLDWSTPDQVEFEGTSIALVSLLVGATTAPSKNAYLWVSMGDSPEVILRRVDGADITVK